MSPKAAVRGCGRPDIAFFDAYPHVRGGAQQVTLLLAGELLRRGWSVQVVLPDRGAFAEKLATDHVPHCVVGVPFPLRRYGGTTRGWFAVLAAMALPVYWWQLRRVFRAFDLVHVSSQRGLILAAVPARLAGARLVWHVHGIRRPRLLNLAGRLLAHATIAVTPEVAGSLPARRVRPPPVVLGNPVDDRYLAVARSPTSPPLLLTAARLHPEKGLDVLLRALALVRCRRPDLTAVVMGEAPEGHEGHRRWLLELAQELHLSDAVSFAGFVDEPQQLAAGAMVYVQPSRREGFGLAVLEAMAAGIPVVASEVEGLKRLVSDGVTGTLVPPDDPPALAEGILAVLDDPDQAEHRATVGRGVIQGRYSVGSVVDRLITLYLTTGDGPRARRQRVRTMAATRSAVIPKETERSKTTRPP